MEMNAVSTICMKGLGLSGAALALVLFGSGAQAQAPKTDAAPKATAAKAKKPPACKSVKAQAGCEERSDCQWVGESKDAKGKVKAKAYCRAKASK
jgi:hypothetical protein